MSRTSLQFNVESYEGLEEASHAARRVIFHVEVLKSAKLCTGDIIAIAGADHTNPVKDFAVGIAWASLEISQDAVMIPISLQLTARVEPGWRVRIFPLSGHITKLPYGLPTLRQAREASTIHLKEILLANKISDTASRPLHGDSQKDWLNLLLREALVDVKYVTNTQVIEVVYETVKRRFMVTSVIAKGPNTEGDMLHEQVVAQSQIWIFSWDSRVNINDPKIEDNLQKSDVEHLLHHSESEAYSSVGGLDKQIEEIKSLLEIPLTRPELFRYFGLKPPRGILLHGPPGTGKTHLARAIASSTKSSVLVINGPELSSAYHGETESKLRAVFKEAREKSPCIVVLDEVDALVPRREDAAGGEVEKRVVATLLTLLDGMEDSGADGAARVIVIGTTNRPNAIDPALRRPGRFDREIEIGIPNAEARLSILSVLLAKTPHTVSPNELRIVASRAHGYVGADLSAVVREAGTTAIKRWLAGGGTGDPSSIVTLALTFADMEVSMPSVRPSAMRSLFVDAPPVRFTDIGGQSQVIQKLREAVEWPLLHPEAFQRLGVKPPKGVLLYGPPGCSKTVLARACACESGVNFLAVKGPELLNKFVGESERAVREIFRKARAAAPSIIFFDEIDALASSRSSSETDSGSAHEGVLTSLLNELDGVHELLGVTVLAATNRPEAVDSALLRPGRLDRILYVSPPDHAGREEILRIRMKNMAVEPDIDICGIADVTEGYSGAEIMALCQEAAIIVMQTDINAPFVSQSAFFTAAKMMKRQITPEILEKFARWQKVTGAKTLF